MTTGLVIAIIGAFLAAVLPGIGSAYGVQIGGQAAAGVVSEKPELFGKLLGFKSEVLCKLSDFEYRI